MRESLISFRVNALILYRKQTADSAVMFVVGKFAYRFVIPFVLIVFHRFGFRHRRVVRQGSRLYAEFYEFVEQRFVHVRSVVPAVGKVFVVYRRTRRTREHIGKSDVANDPQSRHRDNHYHTKPYGLIEYGFSLLFLLGSYRRIANIINNRHHSRDNYADEHEHAVILRLRHYYIPVKIQHRRKQERITQYMQQNT